MLWGVDKFKSIPKGFCFYRWICFIKGTRATGIQVVHNQCDELCILVFIGDCFQETSPVPLGFGFKDIYESSSCQRLACKKHITRSTAHILIVVSCLSTGSSRNRTFCFGNQLFWRFVHAYNWTIWVIGAFINVQDHLHIGDETAAFFGWNHPPLLSPRFNFVFFNMRRIASWEMLSI